MFNTEFINLRKLDINDLEYMYKWLSYGFAAEWYGKRQFRMREI